LSGNRGWLTGFKPILHRAPNAFFDVLDSVTIEEIARNSGELYPILEASCSGRPSLMPRISPGLQPTGEQ